MFKRGLRIKYSMEGDPLNFSIFKALMKIDRALRVQYSRAQGPPIQGPNILMGPDKSVKAPAIPVGPIQPFSFNGVSGLGISR